MQITPPLWQKVKKTSNERGEWKSWLKLNIQKTNIHQSHHFKANSGYIDRLYFGGAPKSLQIVTAVMKLKDGYSLEEKLWQI